MSGRSHEHPAVTGDRLRRIIFSDFPETVRADQLLEYTAHCHGSSLTPQNLAQVFLAIGNLARNSLPVQESLTQNPNKNYLRDLFATARRQLDSFDTRNIGETLLGISGMRRTDEPLTAALIGKAGGCVEEFSPEQLIFTLGVATSTGVPENLRSHLTEPAMARIRREADTYSNTDLVRAILYASRLDNPHDTTFLGELAIGRRESLTSDELGILNSAGKNQLPRTQFLCHAVIEEVAERLHQQPHAVNSREIFEVIEYQARAGVAHQPFIDGLLKRAPERIAGWSPRDCHHVLRCLAVLSVRDEQTTALLGDKIAIDIDNQPWHDRSVSAWSLARLNTPHTALFTAINERLPRLSNEPHLTQDLATLAWSFAVVEKESARPAIELLSKLFDAKKPEAQEIRQMYHARVAVGLQPPGSYPSEVREIAEQEILASERNLFEYDVLSHLQKILPASAYQLDVTVEGLCPDFVIETNGRRIILECDGTQYHHLSDGTPKGNDSIQDVIMERAGYELKHLTDTEWFRLSKEVKDDYLRSFLGL